MFNMGKIQMEFCIHNEDGDVVSKIVFDSLEDIDFALIGFKRLVPNLSIV